MAETLAEMSEKTHRYPIFVDVQCVEENLVGIKQLNGIHLFLVCVWAKNKEELNHLLVIHSVSHTTQIYIPLPPSSPTRP